MSKKKGKIIDDNFTIFTKYNLILKYIFGNEKHKDLLISLLSDILAVSEEEFKGIELIYNR